MRAVTGRPVKIRFRLEDEGGVLTDADSATTVNVAVLDGAGTPVASGAATRETAGIYFFTLAAQTQLDVLEATAVFTLGAAQVAVTEPVRLVDRRLVPLSVLRGYDELAELTLPDFLWAVDQAEDWITAVLNYSPTVTGDRKEFRLRTYSARLEVPGVYYPAVPYSLAYNDVAYDGTKLTKLVVRTHALEYQTAYYTAGYDPVLGIYGPQFPPGVYTAHLAHGLSEAPKDLVKAAASLTRHVAKTSSYPERATRIMTEASEIWFSTPDGDKRPTGLPEVDGVLTHYRIETPFADDAGAF